MTNQKKVLQSIKQAFVEQDKYLFDKHVPEFMIKGKFLGDCYIQIIVEPNGKKPPRFYQSFSPFDVISKQAPDRAVVFENGKLLLDIDFTDEVVTRTAAMDTLVLESLGVTSLKDKKILMLGTGKIAKRSLEILKGNWKNLKSLDCISRSGDLKPMMKFGDSIGVTIKTGSLKQVQDYDFILCHTSAIKAVLGKEYIPKIKKGAVITTFISSTEHGEVADEFYNTQKANVICDWPQTLISSKDLARSIASGKTNQKNVIMLKELFSTRKTIDDKKQYTIYRTSGTPIQNLAILKLKVNS